MPPHPDVFRAGVLVAAAAICAGVTAVRADDAADRAQLRQAGLRPLSAYYVLDGETQLNKMMRQVRELHKELTSARSRRSDAERQANRNNEQVIQYARQRRLLRQQLARARTIRERNRIVTALNELGDRMTLLAARGQDSQPLRTARTAAGQAQEKFAQHVIAMRRLVDQMQARYAVLAADPRVAAAIKRLDMSTGRHRRLGPSSILLRNERLLKKLEASVLSESIRLRASPSGLMFVTAMINGKHAIEMAVDTGAGIVLLPEEVARKAAIPIVAEGPTIHLQMADGRAVEAVQTKIQSLRIGKFAAADVPCAVLPKAFGNPTPLLGQSYLRNFSYRIDPGSARLILTKVHSVPPTGKRRE